MLIEKALSFYAEGESDLQPSLDKFDSQGIYSLPHENPSTLIESLPFTSNDATAGSETELQAVVLGKKDDVDLPQIIESSNYYANIVKRIAAGETPKRLIAEIERYLNENREQVWENSWVRFPERMLSPFARDTLRFDLLADKKSPRKGNRSDISKFIFEHQGESFIRVPISYLIKLSIAELIGSQRNLPKAILETGVRLMPNFLSDNTSPETISLHVVPLRLETGLGRALARETSKRFLLTQLLISFANKQLGLESSGQRAMVYFAPHPPMRQQQLNDCISDSFYRELFMSPCLSGWDHGEEKHAYMHLCHQVLSRSQLNAVAKLQEAGIIVNNLIVLPNLSNTSAANNGIHVSIGSRKLTEAMSGNAISAEQEKQTGDLVIKIFEHFLPLFVGTYSASPYRHDFTDLHPERVLGFLPHQLDYTHLRMIWRRWRKKSKTKIFGRPISPFGPKWLDHLLSRTFRLKGDFVSDFRSTNYFVSLMSTAQSPGLDGKLGNCDRLKSDLGAMGVFDAKLATYLLYRLREFAVMGFSGFEGRHYSLFDDLEEDMGQAVNLQLLVTALAFKYIAQGRYTHVDIPDDPSIESERRQMFFGTAIGIPVFNVRPNTPNMFLRSIIEKTKKVRDSRRYSGFLKINSLEYRKALVDVLIEDAADLIEMFGLQSTIDDLKLRLDHPFEMSTAGKLTKGILSGTSKRGPFSMKAEEFNLQSERYYRDILRKKHQAEALKFLGEGLRWIDGNTAQLDDATRKALRFCLGEMKASEFLARIEADLMDDTLPVDELKRAINLLLISISVDIKKADESLRPSSDDRYATSIR